MEFVVVDHAGDVGVVEGGGPAELGHREVGVHLVTTGDGRDDELGAGAHEATEAALGGDHTHGRFGIRAGLQVIAAFAPGVFALLNFARQEGIHLTGVGGGQHHARDLVRAGAHLDDEVEALARGLLHERGQVVDLAHPWLVAFLFGRFDDFDVGQAHVLEAFVLDPERLDRVRLQETGLVGGAGVVEDLGLGRLFRRKPGHLAARFRVGPVEVVVGKLTGGHGFEDVLGPFRKDGGVDGGDAAGADDGDGRRTFVRFLKEAGVAPPTIKGGHEGVGANRQGFAHAGVLRLQSVWNLDDLLLIEHRVLAEPALCAENPVLFHVGGIVLPIEAAMAHVGLAHDALGGLHPLADLEAGPIADLDAIDLLADGDDDGACFMAVENHRIAVLVGEAESGGAVSRIGAQLDVGVTDLGRVDHAEHFFGAQLLG